MKKINVFVFFAVILCFSLTIAGTLAWLFFRSDLVENTFTVGNIQFSLSQSEGAEESPTEIERNFTILPGRAIALDPVVTVLSNSEACYLFVSAKEENNTVSGMDGKIVQWTVDNGSDPHKEWTPVPGHDGYWYREVPRVPDTDQDGERFYILTSNSDYEKGFVVFNKMITEDIMQELRFGIRPEPTLTFVAAAVQMAHVDSVSDAWDLLPVDFTG